jgi:subtilase family serine protease
VSIPPAYGYTTAPTQVCGYTVCGYTVCGYTVCGYTVCGYTPAQLRQAYRVAGSPYTGKGATVAIVLDAR